VRRLPFITVFVWLFAASQTAFAAAPSANPDAALRFNEVEFLPRWAQADQHEFTPAGQEDLEHWTDMLTVRYYRPVTEGEGLAATANGVLENYKKAGALVVRTSSLPRTGVSPAEHLIVVLFPRPDFIEAAFARFKLTGGIGSSVVYSHRLYGKKIGNDMSAWLKANGPAVEQALMGWSQLPVAGAAKK